MYKTAIDNVTIIAATKTKNTRLIDNNIGNFQQLTPKILNDKGK